MLYVIQVRTGEEKEVAQKLGEYGIKALVPKEKRIIRSGGAWKYKEYILFTGYVFLKMEYNADNYYLIKKIPGVIRFLGGGSPLRLSYLEEEWVLSLTGKDNAPIEPTIVRKTEDEKIEIVSGVLKRFEGRITEYNPRQHKAAFEITICNEKKEVQLSIMLEEEKLKLAEPEQEAPASAAEQVLKEAT